ncbi:MAG: hemolysin family protein [Gammaproteobacteria bacterium]
MSTAYTLSLVIVLLAANGFFVAAEFALVKARLFRIQTRAKEGSRSAHRTLAILDNLEAYLAACQLGITMASLGLGWIGEPFVAGLIGPLLATLDLSEAAIHQVSFLTGFLIFSSLHIVIGEQVPKSFAIRQADTVSLWIAYPLHFCYVVVYPLNWLLDRASRGILSLFGVGEATHADVLTVGEIKGLVATSRAAGRISSIKSEMLQNLLGFGRQPVSAVMIARPDVVTLDITDDAATNMAIVRESEHSRYPLIRRSDDSIHGVLLTKDIFGAMLAGSQSPWDNLVQFAREPLVVPANIGVSRVMEQMRQRRMHIAIVVDEYGQMVGVVSLEDLLEEITGEIRDETDTTEGAHGIRVVKEGHWVADGLAPIADVERAIRTSLEHDPDTHTLSGLFMSSLARLPIKGDVLEVSGHQLTVLSVDRRRVGYVGIERLPAPGSGQAPDN